MKGKKKILRALALTVALLAAGQGAWATTKTVTYTMSINNLDLNLAISGDTPFDGTTTIESRTYLNNTVTTFTLADGFSFFFRWTTPLESNNRGFYHDDSSSSKMEFKVTWDFINNYSSTRYYVTNVKLTDADGNLMLLDGGGTATTDYNYIPRLQTNETYDARKGDGSSNTTGVFKKLTITYTDTPSLDYFEESNGRYKIQSLADLCALADYVNIGGNTAQGLTFYQTEDITFDKTKENNFTRIGYFNFNHEENNMPFRGTYDGSGKTISGINYNHISEDDPIARSFIGLFPLLEGTVENIILSNSTFTGRMKIGAIAGSVLNGGIIRNCHVESSVSINAGVDNAQILGGISGDSSGSIEGCICAASVSSNDKSCNYVGGIIGMGGGIIKNCLYTGTTITADSYKGAIAGSASATLTNNYYTSDSVPGGVNGSDKDGARRARTVTLGEDVVLMGDESAYSVSDLTAIDTGNYALSSGSTIYSGEGQTLTLSYSGEVPAGSTVVYTVTKTSGGSDVTADVLSGTTLTMPAYDVTVNAVIYAQGESESNPFVVTSWADLKEKMAAGGYIRLDADVTDPDKTSGSQLIVPYYKTVTLDLNGHTIDRGMTGGIYLGEVIDVDGSLTLNDSGTGGTITGGNSNQGGGVGVGGSFTMNGGAISGNTSGDLGGGVYVCGGTFTMNGGTITSNTARKGGGVYLTNLSSSSESTFTMNGGTISGNTATIGGGVYNSDNEKDNTIKVSGNPVISGNTNAAGNEENFYYDVYYMDDEKNNLIIIYAPLSTGASIGVSVPGPLSTGGDPIEIAMGATDGDSQYFHSDVTCYTIEEGQGEQAGKLLLAPPASTPWSELKAQLEDGNDVTLTDDVTALDCDGDYPEITKTVTLDLNGHNITVNENSEHIIYMDDNGNLTLTGSGTISGSKEYAVNCSYSTSTFTMIGGTISGGTGGGVYVKNGTFNVSGSPVITGNTKNSNARNVYLNTGKVINVTGPLGADARIGVTTKTAPTAGNPVTFAQGSGGHTLTAADASRFSSDDSDYYVGYDNVNHVAYLTVDPSDAGIVGITLTGALSGGFYWATFYNQNLRFTLPEGSAAYTMDASHHLYRLGSDGRTIRENTAVVIISDKAEITLTRTGDDSAIDINGGANILSGFDSPTAVAGTPYVLGVVGGKLGFYEYTGGNVPAHKAYYTE